MAKENTPALSPLQISASYYGGGSGSASADGSAQPQKTATVDGTGSASGNLTMPSFDVEVKVSPPPKISYYWVIKQNIDRLRDALTDERADRRLEFLFGFSGLSLGSLESAISSIIDVAGKKVPSFFDFVLTIAFVVSVLAVIYFWRFVTPTTSKVDSILTDIEENKKQIDVSRP